MKGIFRKNKKRGEDGEGSDEEDDLGGGGNNQLQQHFERRGGNGRGGHAEEDYYDAGIDTVAGGSHDPSRANTKGRMNARGMGGGGGGGRSAMGDEVSVDPSAYHGGSTAGAATQIRPNYRNFSGMGGHGGYRMNSNQEGDHDDDGIDDDDDDNNEGMSMTGNRIENSAGANRLNRILQSNGYNIDGNDMMLDEDDIIMEAVGLPVGGTSSNFFHNEKFGAARMVKVSDPTDLQEVGMVSSRFVIPPLKVDPSSIGGNMLDGYPTSMLQETLITAACSDFEFTGAQDNTIPISLLQFPAEYAKHKRSLGLFGGVGNKGRSTKRRYVMIARSTNKSLLGRPKDVPGANPFNPLLSSRYNNNVTDEEARKNMLDQYQSDENVDESDRADYDAMFSPDAEENLGDDDPEKNMDDKDGDNNDDKSKQSPKSDDPNVSADSAGAAPAQPSTEVKASSLKTPSDGKTAVKGKKSVSIGATPSKDSIDATRPLMDDDDKSKLPVGRVNFDILEEQEEISSFPVLICVTFNQDGTAPDIRKLISLDQLTTVQDLQATVVQLAFNNGDTIRLDFGGNVNDKDKAVERSALDKERFIWSLLQIHAILCMAVVERNSMENNIGQSNMTMVSTAAAGAAANKENRMYLPPLNVRNLDRAELQYVATVNGFLRKSKLLCALLNRQRSIVDHANNNQAAKNKNKTKGTTTLDTPDGGKGAKAIASEEKIDMESMEEMAYDLMMGNFATRVTLFHSEEERKDAEEILNSTEWTNMLITNTDDQSAAMNVAQLLGSMLQGKMRDLEAETCRRLIAWEDEKHLSVSRNGRNIALHDESDDRDTVDALALASLFKTLEALDSELLGMESWLQDRAAAIKPLTDDCADIEEENRQLEQQKKSYDMLGNEMKRLLQGLEINEYTEKTLTDPASALIYSHDGTVNVNDSDVGIEKIYEAGKALLDAIEYPKRSGGMHLKAVSERAKGLASISNSFCTSLAQIIVTVMEQFKNEVVASSDHGKVSKNDTHSMIAKKVRDTQRKFQSALLGYFKLIEIVTALSPEMLPALRDAYAEMVAEGILMKKRMKGYFQALPAKSVAHLNRAGKDLKDYIPFTEDAKDDVVNAPDIRAALTELLPVIAREAYFTSALFGSNKKEQDGREKKRNFENAKGAVDKASIHFRYYINRTCGIIDLDNSRSVDLSRVDPMLCLVSTIYLNEAMDNYIDREKKGGDHSLSLAYVRATILDLRKKADKQWVAWVEKQIEWIKTHEGVPSTGKRAGVFASFARFPKYLDHLNLCCSEGREIDYVPDLAGIKVINYYLQKMAVNLLESLKECANRDGTEKTYAANVMKMENTYFFTQSIKKRGEMMSKLFSKQVMKANAICKESTDAYLGWMIKREFTALHELFSRVSKARKDFGDKEVIKHVPKDQFVKILQKEANREVLKEKIGAMFTRMEKHLSEEGLLLVVAWKALVKVLYEWFGRWEKLCTTIYHHKVDPSAVDVVRIAKAAGGSATGMQKPKGAPGSTPNDSTTTGNTSEFGFKSILALGGVTNHSSAAGSR